ncbi:hypothetical protein [Chryseobacterium mulctrae]|uniref:hypothetical protein n=1 Tax=Chryseobacterium mulctrae TaxID=2576777 RepID=UPI0011173A32|nr:hypothetical protein [Chryseobacterium mulctrae]
MEKKIIIFCFVVLGFTFYSYPVFDSEGISYLIIFCCFIMITFSVAKIYNPSDKNNYESVEKEVDYLENLDGIFSYQKDGFYFTLKEKTDFIKWAEIIEVNSFSIPFLHEERHSRLEIITEKMGYEFNYQQTSGIEKLTNQLIENLSHWNFDAETVKINNHGLKKTNLYKRS